MLHRVTARCLSRESWYILSIVSAFPVIINKKCLLVSIHFEALLLLAWMTFKFSQIISTHASNIFLFTTMEIDRSQCVVLFDTNINKFVIIHNLLDWNRCRIWMNDWFTCGTPHLNTIRLDWFYNRFVHYQFIVERNFDFLP